MTTLDDLRSGLQALGLAPDATVIVHASLGAFGYIPGGEQTVLLALREVVGEAGTIVMPTQSWQLCDPDYLDDPALDPAAREEVRRSLPAFDADLTPTRTMGRLAELFRSQPSSCRSPHPHRSFAAQGPLAQQITAHQPLAMPFGEESPLAALYERDAAVLLLGVGYDKCTALHLAEYRAMGEGHPMMSNGAAFGAGEGRRWEAWREPVVVDDDFGMLGAAFERAASVRVVSIGAAECRLLSMRDLVDFAVDWLAAHRP